MRNVTYEDFADFKDNLSSIIKQAVVEELDDLGLIGKCARPRALGGSATAAFIKLITVRCMPFVETDLYVQLYVNQ